MYEEEKKPPIQMRPYFTVKYCNPKCSNHFNRIMDLGLFFQISTASCNVVYNSWFVRTSDEIFFWSTIIVNSKTIHEIYTDRHLELKHLLSFQYPKVFSFGAASHEGPPEQKMNNTQFTFLFTGNGWAEKSADSKTRQNDDPVKTHVTKVTGINPGYGATCVAVLLSAITILKENSMMPGK